MTQPKIIVVSDEGDPASPKTWSGTPSNLIEALRNVGCDVGSLNLTVRRSHRAAMAAVSLATGRGREFRRTNLYSNYLRLTKAANMVCDPDVVFLHTSTTTILPAKSRAWGCRHVLFLDSTFHLVSQYTLNTYSKSVRLQYDEFEAKALQAADFIFPASECAAQDLITHYGTPAERVLPVGTGLGKIQPSSESRDYSAKTILFVAKQRFLEKGGQLLLDAFKLCHARDSSIQLVVIATEKNREAVEAIPGVTYKSNLPWDELQTLFNRSTLYAMPALFEPWGLVYLEALLCSTPILGLNRNAFPELSNHGTCGFVVDQATPEAVAKAIDSALSNAGRLAEMGKAGHRYVKDRYSWTKTAGRICSTLFSELELQLGMERA